MQVFRSFLLFIFSVTGVSFIASANDSTYEKQLMQRIYYAQSHGTGYFAKGLFPSFRDYYFNRGAYKNDDNIFFTALVAFTLQDLKPRLQNQSNLLIDSIVKNA